jgi:malonyl-CoA/methylmalonyl-CoA synthetase
LSGRSDGNGFFHRLRAAFPRDPTATLLETEGGRVYSYADALESSARFARLLRASGLHIGDRLLVQVEKSPEVIFLYLACLRAGVIFLPVNVAYKEEELGFFMEDAEPAGIVCDPRVADIMEGLRASRSEPATVWTLDGDGAGTLVDAALHHQDRFDDVPLAEDDVAAILYTSGTTGRPKGAMLTHCNLASNGKALHDAWGFVREDVLLHALPLFHAHGLFTALSCVLLSGSRMLFLARFDAKAVCRLLPRATVMMGVPTFYTRLLAESVFGAELCAHMRLFTSGSAPLLPETFERFLQRTGCTMLERYGTTEAMIITSNPLEGERRCGTVGHPLPGIEVRIADDADQPMKGQSTGRVQCRGPNLFKGYWRRPQESRDAFTADGHFITGDLGFTDADGYITLVGRESDMIISGGYNVYPREVENVLDRVPGVEESAVFGVPHPDFGEGVVAAVKVSGGSEVTEAGVIAYARAHLANYKVPKRVLIVPELPRNPMGKVQKNLLRERHGAEFAPPADAPG